MENRKGNGIFLGIVSVATLIIAIIGATFAYFSATTNSAENAVNLQAYEYSLGISVNQVWQFKSGLIPMNPDTVIEGASEPNNTNLLYAINEAETKCVDNVNNLQVCALYSVTITNNAANPVKLAGQIKTIANNPGTGTDATPFKNLTYQEVIGTPESGFTLGTTKNTIPEAVATDDGVTGITEIASIEIDGTDDPEQPASTTSYILIYLNENGNQSSEMGATYEGQLIYTSEGEGGSTLTGTFRIS